MVSTVWTSVSVLPYRIYALLSDHYFGTIPDLNCHQLTSLRWTSKTLVYWLSLNAVCDTFGILVYLRHIRVYH